MGVREGLHSQCIERDQKTNHLGTQGKNLRVYDERQERKRQEGIWLEKQKL